MCALKKEMVLSIYLVSKGHGSPESKKQLVTGRISEKLNSSNKKGDFKIEREKVTFDKGVVSFLKKKKKKRTHGNKYSLNFL